MAKKSKRKAALAAAEAAKLAKAAEHAAKATAAAAQMATFDAVNNAQSDDATGAPIITEAKKTPPEEYEKITGIQKVATVITAMGSANAASVYKFLGDRKSVV